MPSVARVTRASSQVAPHFSVRVRRARDVRGRSRARDAQRVTRACMHVLERHIHHFARVLSYPRSRVAPSRAHASARHDQTVDRTSIESKIEKRVRQNATTSENVCRCVDVNFVRQRDVEMLDVPT
jgi:hypothetical protein